MGRTSATPSWAAVIAFCVKVVVTLSPPPSISSSSKPSRISSSRTMVSTWPRWPPYWLSCSISGNSGSLREALSASSAEIIPSSAIAPSTAW